MTEEELRALEQPGNWQPEVDYPRLIGEIRRMRALVRPEDIAELRSLRDPQSGGTTVGRMAGLADRLEKLRHT